MTLVNTEHIILYREHKHYISTSTPLKIRKYSLVSGRGEEPRRVGGGTVFSGYLYLVVLI